MVSATSWSFERVAGPFKGATGGVVWDGRNVLFSAILESRILRYDVESGETTMVRRFTNRVSGLALDWQGRLFGCQEGSRRIIELNADGSATPLGASLEGRRVNFPSDLAIDRGGRIWFADAYHALASHGPQLFAPLPHSSVLRLDRHAVTHDWVVTRGTFDTSAPRSVCLSRDERTLYVAEGDLASEAARELRAYPIDDAGTLGAPTVLHSFGRDHRGPHRGVEGMCLDSEGNIVACAGSRRAGPGPLIYVFSPHGRVLETHPLPHDLPMRCAFGGWDLSDLYVTSGEGSLWRARDVGRRGQDRATP